MAVGRMTLSMSPLAILSWPMDFLMLLLHQAERLVGPGLTPVRYFMDTWKHYCKSNAGMREEVSKRTSQWPHTEDTIGETVFPFNPP